MKINELRKLTQNYTTPTTPQEQQVQYDYLRSLGIEPTSFYQEMDMSSRYVDTHRDVSFSNTMVQLHSHSFYEVLCCTNTCGAEYLVGSERYRLQKGDIIFIAPGLSHRPILPEHMVEPYKRDVLWISKEFVELLVRNEPELMDGRKRASNLLRTAGTRWEFLAEKFRFGVQEFESQAPGWETAVMGNTMVILTHLRRAFRDHSAAPLKAEKPELLDQVMAYIERNYAQKITLGDVAKYFYVSESTISHLFKQKMGVGFYRCVTQRRLIAAKTMIQEGKHLEDISQAVGFSDYSAFYRAFKQEYGISPRQFIQLQNN